MDKVAGFLEVGRTDDTNEVVISVPDLKPDCNGAARIVVLPRYARHLANLLIEHATAAEAAALGKLPQRRPYKKLKHDGKSSRPK